MSDRLNVSLPMDAIRTSPQARAVLDVLAKHGGANTRLLEMWLATIGLAASSRAEL